MEARVVGQELLERLEAELEATRKDNSNREDRLNNLEIDLSDCYISRQTGIATEELLKAKIQILKDKGLSAFKGLFDLEGNLVSERPFKTRFGFVFKTPEGQLVSAHLTDKGLAKKGYKYGDIWVAAWATYGSGNCSKIFRSDINYWTGEEA